MSTGYGTYMGAGKVFQEIPKLGLKLLVHPNLQMMNGTANEVLGANVITNGTFDDFTMGEDADTKGHWVLDSIYNSNNGCGAYIGEDINDAPADNTELYDSAASTFESGTYSWAAYGSNTIENDNKSLKCTYVDNGAGAYNYLRDISDLNSDLTVGNVYLVSGRVKTNPGSSVQVLIKTSGDTFYSQDVTSTTFVDFSMVFVCDSTNGNYIRFNLGSGEIIWVDNLSIKEVSKGNGLIFRKSQWENYADLEASLLGSNPAYNGGNALAFDGATEYLTRPAAQATDFNPGINDFTVEAWIKINNLTYHATILEKKSSSGQGWSVGIHYTNGHLGAYIEGATTNSGFKEGTIDLDDNTWHYVAVVITQTTIDFYVDGAHDVQRTFSSVGSITNSIELELGNGNGYGYFEGNISEVRYTQTALTANEIADSYGAANSWESDPGNPTENSSNSNFQQKIIGDGSVSLLKQSITTNVNTLYRFDINYEIESGGTGAIYSQNNLIPYKVLTGTGVYSGYFEGYGATRDFYMRCDTNGKYAIFDNYRVRPVLNCSNLPGEWIDSASDRDWNFVEDFSLGGVRYGTEHIQNGNFEGSFSSGLGENWSEFGNITTTQETSIVHNGSNAQRIKATATSSNYIGQVVSPTLTVGNYYRLTCWVYVVNGTVKVSNLVDTYTKSITGASWTKFESYFTAQYSGAQLRFSVDTLDDEGIIDDVSIVDVTNGYHGKAYDDFASDQPAHPSALKFDGVDQSIVFEDNDSLDCDGQSSILAFAWFKNTNDYDNIEQILGKYGFGGDGWNIHCRADNHFEINVSKTGGSQDNLQTLATLDDDTWYFGVGIINETDDELELWLNGEYDNQKSFIHAGDDLSNAYRVNGDLITYIYNNTKHYYKD
jgi:hypothetical protein